MTLKTSVVIGRPTNVHELYAFCRELVRTPPDAEPAYGPSDPEIAARLGQKWIINPTGCGASAWLGIQYGIDGPMVHVCAGECDEQDEARHVKDPRENGWAAVEVWFDTSGLRAGELHARLVRKLGKWLDAKDLPWKWCNEYTGEWFDRYDGLGQSIQP